MTARAILRTDCNGTVSVIFFIWKWKWKISTSEHTNISVGSQSRRAKGGQMRGDFRQQHLDNNTFCLLNRFGKREKFSDALLLLQLLLSYFPQNVSTCSRPTWSFLSQTMITSQSIAIFQNLHHFDRLLPNVTCNIHLSSPKGSTSKSKSCAFQSWLHPVGEASLLGRNTRKVTKWMRNGYHVWVTYPLAENRPSLSFITVRMLASG